MLYSNIFIGVRSFNHSINKVSISRSFLVGSSLILAVFINSSVYANTTLSSTNSDNNQDETTPTAFQPLTSQSSHIHKGQVTSFVPDDSDLLQPALNAHLVATDTQTQLTHKLMEKAYKEYDTHHGFDDATRNNSSIKNTSDNKTDKTALQHAPRCSGYWVYPSQKNNGSNNESENSSTNLSPHAADVHNGGFYALADYGYYDNKDYAELVGNVTVQQGKQTINAEKVILDLVNQTATAQGEVMFTDRANNSHLKSSNSNNSNDDSDIKDTIRNGGIVGIADSINYDTHSETAKANNIAFSSIPMQAHGYAKSLSKNSESQYNIEQVVFSTCSPLDRKWQLDAEKIDLDTKTGRGKAYKTKLKIKDIPVFYLPYFNFPIDERRSSGFLTPSFSYNSVTDFEISVPYYLNLAENYDATLSSRIFTDRNPMATTEVRYLTDGYGEGRLVGSYLPSDKKFNNQNRSSVLYEHRWHSESNPNLTAELEYNHVSDASYTDDFEHLGNDSNQLNLPRHASINYSNENLDAELKIETYQSIEATDLYGNRIQDKDRPYNRLPQLSVNYFSASLADTLKKVGVLDEKNPLTASNIKSNTDNNQTIKKIDNIQINAQHDSAYFKKDISDNSSLEKSGFRMFNELSASYPYVHSWGHITPKLSLKHIYAIYDEDTRVANNISNQEKSQSVFVPQVSLDAQAKFTKEGTPFAWLTKKSNQTIQGPDKSASFGYQTLSPRVKYSYAPFKNQNTIPNFNTQIATINHEQLYADSWFLGHDRLQDLHAITPGVNYRYIDAMGQTRLDASIAQQYYLDKGQVSLDDGSVTSTTITKKNNLFNNGSSGLVSRLSAQPYDNFWVDVNAAFTNDYDINYLTSQVRYQPSKQSQFSLGFVERKADVNTNQQPISAVTGSGIFPINDNWRVMSQTQYDYDADKFLNTTLGIDYEDCCFGFAIYGRRYYNELNSNEKPNDAVMAEIRLSGLSDKNSRLRKHLSQQIIGIDSVNESWKRSY